MFRWISSASAIGLALFAAAASADNRGYGGDVTVVLEGLRSDQGRTICRLYPEGANFPREGSRERVEGEIEDRRSACVFRNVPPGRYAVATAHDEDGDGRVDRNFFGIPEEGFAFSRNARPGFGPPDFEEAAVYVLAEGAQLRIRMTYF